MRVPITRYGYRRLLRELLHLRRVVRPQVLEDLQEARAYGVKSDNQQYLNARERHVVLQKKIQDIEEKLARCEIVVGRKYYFKKVGFGTVIVIQTIDTGVTCRYELVGPYESDVSAGELAAGSPLGRRLMGRPEGDQGGGDTPAGIRIYRGLSIQI